MKQLSDLIYDMDETWEMIKQWISESNHSVETLKTENERADRTLLDLQVSTKSVLGAVAYLTGGILINNGWLRFLGSGSQNFTRTLSTWNDFDSSRTPTKMPGTLLVADDVVGGFFAINGGSLGSNLGEIYYLAPDSLEWENLEIQYSTFLKWSLSDKIYKFYESFRWKNWESEVELVTGDNGISIYPYLWAKGPTISERSRRTIPIEELWGITLDFRKQLGIDC